MKKPRIILIANHKGGVGKTTTTASVGAILAKMGYKTLLIDLDPQGNLTFSLHDGEVGDSIYEAMTDRIDALPVIEISENLYLVPSTLDLCAAEIELTSVMSRESILRNLLEPIQEDYDIILMDCPPSLGILTINGMVACNEIIVPLTAEALPFKGFEFISKTVSEVHKKLNRDAHISGVLITRYEKSRLSENIEEKMRQTLGALVFQTKIRKNITVASAPINCQNIVDYSPGSNGAKDYMSFTEELLTRLGVGTGK